MNYFCPVLFEPVSNHVVQVQTKINGSLTLNVFKTTHQERNSNFTGVMHWPNTIQCLGSDDIMSLGIKSSATEVLGSWSLVHCYLLLFLLLIVAICYYCCC